MGDDGIFLVDFARAKLRRVAGPAAAVCGPYFELAGGNPGEIWLFDTRDFSRRQTHGHAQGVLIRAAYSADGNRIAYLAPSAGGPGAPWQVMVADLWQPTRRRLTKDGLRKHSVGISADGRTVFFARQTSHAAAQVARPGMDLFAAPYSGGEERRLTVGLEIINADLTSDGHTIILAALAHPGPDGLYAINVAGGLARLLPAPSTIGRKAGISYTMLSPLAARLSPLVPLNVGTGHHGAYDPASGKVFDFGHPISGRDATPVLGPDQASVVYAEELVIGSGVHRLVWQRRKDSAVTLLESGGACQAQYVAVATDLRNLVALQNEARRRTGAYPSLQEMRFRPTSIASYTFGLKRVGSSFLAHADGRATSRVAGDRWTVHPNQGLEHDTPRCRQALAAGPTAAGQLVTPRFGRGNGVIAAFSPDATHVAFAVETAQGGRSVYSVLLADGRARPRVIGRFSSPVSLVVGAPSRSMATGSGRAPPKPGLMSRPGTPQAGTSGLDLPPRESPAPPPPTPPASAAP